jgi:DNA invertase Pin-like site-specific DNA recombinase
MATVGHARVSTGHQSLATQRDALTAAGCERIFADQLSGVREDRPGLAELLRYVRPGERRRGRRLLTAPCWSAADRGR